MEYEKTTSYKDKSESQRFAVNKIFMFNSYYKMMILVVDILLALAIC